LYQYFLLPPSMEELERRLHARGTDSKSVIAERMSRAEAEISHWPEYEYVLVNCDTVNASVRSKRSSRPSG
jgi:guanylate kinase